MVINLIITKIENEEYEGNIFSHSETKLLQITKMLSSLNLTVQTIFPCNTEKSVSTGGNNEGILIENSSQVLKLWPHIEFHEQLY